MTARQMGFAAIGFVVGAVAATVLGLIVWADASYPTALAVESASGIAVACLAVVAGRP